MRRDKYTHEEVKKYIESLGYILIDEIYKNVFTNMTFKDYEGFYYYACIHNLQKGFIPAKFKKSNIYIINNIKLWCKLNNKPFELLDDQEYISDRVKLKWQCLKSECGDIFEANWNHILHNRGCGVCHGFQVGLSNCLAIRNPKLASEWHPILNGDLTPYNVTYGSKLEVWWLCSKCNYEWISNINNRNNNSCPQCNTSKANNKIKTYCSINNIIHIPEYRFSDCKDNKPLPFDMYILNKNNIYLIEADGIQHYKPVCFGGISYEHALDNLKITQYHDEIKNDYCKNNNIKLIRIPYWEFDNIEFILQKELVI